MIISRNNFFILSSFLIIFSCSQQNKVHSNPIAEKDTVFVQFFSSIDSSLLTNFKFGVCSEQEELPLDYIYIKKCNINRKNQVVISRKSIRNYNISTDSLWGYFEKNGYKSKRFIINRDSSNLKVSIDPLGSYYNIKVKDTSIVFDSIKIELDIKIKNISNKKDIFVMKKVDIISDNILSGEILPNEKYFIGIQVFINGTVSYKNAEFSYQPWVDYYLNIFQ